MNNILYLALAGFIAFVALLLVSLQKPAVPVRTRQSQESAVQGWFGGGNAVWWVLFVIGAIIIIFVR
jgi:hypothetical protein